MQQVSESAWSKNRIMINCKSCGKRIRGDWVFCPMCGTSLDDKLVQPDFHLERIRYLWERQRGGDFIYRNFQSVRDLGVIPYLSVKSVRPTLSDKAHINLLNLGVYCFLLSAPSFITEYYKMGKLLGYYSTNQALKTLKLDRLVHSLSKKGLFWRVFENKRIQETQQLGWLKSGEVILDLVDVNRENQELVYTMEDYPSSIFSGIKKPVCFLPVSILAGQAEGLFGVLWDGVETLCQCMGDSKCEVRLYGHGEETEPGIAVLDKKELNAIVDQIVSGTSSHRKYFNKTGDVSHMSVNQCLNYLLISASRGHEVLLKHAGRLVGERFLSKTESNDAKEVIDYLKDLFLYLKAGILRDPRETSNGAMVTMDESVYSSGVENIGLKLDTFLAGIMEGGLCQATSDRWLVDEVKCLANGDECCEFRCRRQ